VDSNQNHLHPGTMLTSMVKRVDVAVYNAFKGTTPGVTVLGLKEGGVDYALDDNNAKLVSADMKKKVDAAKADIIGGKIKVIDYMATVRLQLMTPTPEAACGLRGDKRSPGPFACHAQPPQGGRARTRNGPFGLFLACEGRRACKRDGDAGGPAEPDPRRLLGMTAARCRRRGRDARHRQALRRGAGQPVVST
jgi:hypothetical protein